MDTKNVVVLNAKNDQCQGDQIGQILAEWRFFYFGLHLIATKSVPIIVFAVNFD
jgi:hypothetical protein